MIERGESFSEGLAAYVKQVGAAGGSGAVVSGSGTVVGGTASTGSRAVGAGMARTVKTLRDVADLAVRSAAVAMSATSTLVSGVLPGTWSTRCHAGRP